MASFTEKHPESLADNVFSLIGNDWMLITAGEMDKFNTMTASWGTVGVIWNKLVAQCYVRPSRYTYEFMENSDYFTLAFFEEQYREALSYCGTYSGRDVDKVGENNLSPMIVGESVGFKEARLIILCRKIYFQNFDPANFLDPDIKKNFPSEDYHRMYTGEIENILCKE